MKDNLLTRLIVFAALFAALYYALQWWMQYQVLNKEIERYNIVKRANDVRGICSAAESRASWSLPAGAAPGNLLRH